MVKLSEEFIKDLVPAKLLKLTPRDGLRTPYPLKT